MDEVYIIFEERLLSCNSDYDDDGFVIVWDSEEFCRNVSGNELLDLVKKEDNELYSKVINRLNDEHNIWKKEEYDYHFTELIEILEDETENIMQKFVYQNVPFVKEVHKTEESAKKRVEYFYNNHAYSNKFYYTRYNVQELGGRQDE